MDYIENGETSDSKGLPYSMWLETLFPSYVSTLFRMNDALTPSHTIHMDICSSFDRNNHLFKGCIYW